MSTETPDEAISKKSQEVAAFLRGLGDHITNVHACTVTLGTQSYPAARYTQRLKPPEGAGNPQEYQETKFYLLGEVPKVAQRRKSCFPFEGGEWFISGGWTNYLLRPFDEMVEYAGAHIRAHHPLGPNFILSLWQIPGEKIDSGRRHPYQRVPMTVNMQFKPEAWRPVSMVSSPNSCPHPSP